jgi:hypothetical protein
MAKTQAGRRDERPSRLRIVQFAKTMRARRFGRRLALPLAVRRPRTDADPFVRLLFLLAAQYERDARFGHRLASTPVDTVWSPRPSKVIDSPKRCARVVSADDWRCP